MKTTAKVMLVAVFGSFAALVAYMSLKFVGAEMDTQSIVTIGIVAITVGIVVNIPLLREK